MNRIFAKCRPPVRPGAFTSRLQCQNTTNAAGVGLQMRTPTGMANNVFAGDSLALCTNLASGAVSLLIKGDRDQGTVITVNNLEAADLVIL